MISKTFVGRGEELIHAREWLEKNPHGLVFITGAGGIGKTSLIRKIMGEYNLNEGGVVDYFDLAEQPMTMLNQAIHLVDSIGREHFPGFVKKLNELETVPGVESAPGGLEAAAIYACIWEIDAYLKSHKKKLLRITDTFEIALRYSHYAEDNWVAGINEKLKAIPGTNFVVAGRDKLEDEDILEKIMPLLSASFGGENILHIPLSGFDDDETDDFFTECDEHRIIPPEMREKLQLLTEGRPILLSLAVEWLQKSIPLPVLIEKSLPELREMTASQKGRRELLDKFEFELISKVRELQNPLDIASLYMAHIDRRMDSRLLSVLLNVGDTRADEILSQLLDLPFVKEYIGSTPKKCTLHDEMRDLVKKHAWEHLDSNGTERKHLAATAINNYYLPRIKELKERKQDLLGESRATLLQGAQAKAEDMERWLLEVEVLHYSCKLGEAEGFDFFDKAFYDNENSYIRDQFMLDELKRSGLDKEKVALRDADGLRRRGKTTEAKRIFSEVLMKEDLGENERILAHAALGALSENEPAVAEENFSKALKMAVSTKDANTQGIMHNNLGRLYRNMSRLDDSIEHFNDALTLFRRIGSLDAANTVRNNLAWTYRLNGDLDQADTLCSLAIAEHRKQGQERTLAYAYLTKSDIDREKGDLPNAMRYAEMALPMFDKFEDNNGKTQTYRALANVSRHLLKFEDAIAYLNSGIQLAESRGSFALQASLQQLYGRTCRHYASYLRDEMKNKKTDHATKVADLYTEALGALEKSIDLAETIGNHWEVARSQIEKALILMLNNENIDETVLYKILDDVWETAKDLENDVLMSYVLENHARIDMYKGRYLEAGHALGEAACLIAGKSGLEIERSFARLKESLLDPDLTTEQSAALAGGVSERIKQVEYQKYSKLAALKNMCQQIMGVEDEEDKA